LQGLGEALLAMQEGDSWEVVVPPQLGYEGRKHGTTTFVAVASSDILEPHAFPRARLFLHAVADLRSSECASSVTIPAWSVLKFDLQLVRVGARE
jgi:hypothetical protein